MLVNPIRDEFIASFTESLDCFGITIAANTREFARAIDAIRRAMSLIDVDARLASLRFDLRLRYKAMLLGGMPELDALHVVESEP